jgi:hypothetical protein
VSDASAFVAWLSSSSGNYAFVDAANFPTTVGAPTEFAKIADPLEGTFQVADCNLDGAVDVVTQNKASDVRVTVQQASPPLFPVASVIAGTGNDPRGGGMYDLNSDGRIDVISADSATETSVSYSLTFQSCSLAADWSSVVKGYGGNGMLDATVGVDFDNSGSVDLITSVGEVLKNTLSAQNRDRHFRVVFKGTGTGPGTTSKTPFGTTSRLYLTSDAAHQTIVGSHVVSPGNVAQPPTHAHFGGVDPNIRYDIVTKFPISGNIVSWHKCAPSQSVLSWGSVSWSQAKLISESDGASLSCLGTPTLSLPTSSVAAMSGGPVTVTPSAVVLSGTTPKDFFALRLGLAASDAGEFKVGSTWYTANDGVQQRIGSLATINSLLGSLQFRHNVVNPPAGQIASLTVVVSDAPLGSSLVSQDSRVVVFNIGTPTTTTGIVVTTTGTVNPTTTGASASPTTTAGAAATSTAAASDGGMMLIIIIAVVAAVVLCLVVVGIAVFIKKRSGNAADEQRADRRQANSSFAESSSSSSDSGEELDDNDDVVVYGAAGGFDGPPERSGSDDDTDDEEGEVVYAGVMDFKEV